MELAQEKIAKINKFIISGKFNTKQEICRVMGLPIIPMELTFLLSDTTIHRKTDQEQRWFSTTITKLFTKETLKTSIVALFVSLGVMAQKMLIDHKAIKCINSAFLVEKRKWKQRDFMYRGRLLYCIM